MSKRFFIFSLLFSTIFTFFIAVFEYEYKGKLDEKFIEEPEYRLYRGKQEDLVLTWEEYQSLKINNPDAVYISEKRYYFVIEGDTIEVSEDLYNSRAEGALIKYKRSLIINTRKKIEP